MADERLWRRRFLAFMAVRLAGVATFLLGVAIAYSDLVREGGWPLVGGIVAIMGAIDALFAPRLLKTLWEQQDRERG
ncbi:MAG TPA: hypothetical protein VFK58_05085 [Sphingomicrobium sp.]|nr:hypothetical protein [Sphingomicrobium sp.]